MKFIATILFIILCVSWNDSHSAERVVYKHNEDRDLYMTITQPSDLAATDQPGRSGRNTE